jgi:hypothetical protein
LDRLTPWSPKILRIFAGVTPSVIWMSIAHLPFAPL